jgi:hypothetical protein
VWSIGIQREVLKDTLIEVSYTAGLIANVNINQSVPGPGAQPPRRPYYHPMRLEALFKTECGNRFTTCQKATVYQPRAGTALCIKVFEEGVATSRTRTNSSSTAFHLPAICETKPEFAAAMLRCSPRSFARS